MSKTQTTRYDAHRLTPEGGQRVDEIKRLAEQLAAKLDEVPGRSASIALTHLETAVMHGVLRRGARPQGTLGHDGPARTAA